MLNVNDMHGILFNSNSQPLVAYKNQIADITHERKGYMNKIVTHSVMKESFERDGLKELARKIAPDVPVDKVSYGALTVRIVSELLHQIALRDKYYFNTLNTLGINEPKHNQTIEELIGDLPDKQSIDNVPWITDENAKMVNEYL